SALVPTSSPAFGVTVTTSGNGHRSVSTAPAGRSVLDPQPAATATTATSAAAAADNLIRARASRASDGGDDGDRVRLLARGRSEDPLAGRQLDLRRLLADEPGSGHARRLVTHLLEHEPARRALVRDGDRVAPGVQSPDALALVSEAQPAGVADGRRDRAADGEDLGADEVRRL